MPLHFDPYWGAPYWIERAATLDFDPRRDIRSIGDLERFGPMPVEELAVRPVEDFIPRRYHDRLRLFVTSETGGTTGAPKRTAYLRDEFETAFVRPFVEAARLMDFPRGLHWLFIGPSGPHIIGKAARACAQATGSMDPFSVDFDPRWSRKLPAQSMARRRYLEHVLEQSEAILRTQRIGILFATPPVLEALGTRMPAEIRAEIRGVHLGGMAGDERFWQCLRDEWYPNAKFMSGYGNSLAGMCPQLEDVPGCPPEYFPYGDRLVLSIESGSAEDEGRVIFHRLDDSAFLPNVVERDLAAGATLPVWARGSGFRREGVRGPHAAPEATISSPGLY